LPAVCLDRAAAGDRVASFEQGIVARHDQARPFNDRGGSNRWFFLANFNPQRGLVAQAVLVGNGQRDFVHARFVELGRKVDVGSGGGH
jgi:hypothetical protein